MSCEIAAQGGSTMRLRSEHSVRSKWYLPKHKFLTAYHYALQYQEWKNEYKTLTDSSKAIRYDIDKVKTTCDADPTEKLAVRRAELIEKIETVEKIAAEAAPDIAKYLLIGVTQEGVSFDYLRTSLGMPCGKNAYSSRRGKFYFILSNYLETK